MPLPRGFFRNPFGLVIAGRRVERRSSGYEPVDVATTPAWDLGRDSLSAHPSLKALAVYNALEAAALTRATNNERVEPGYGLLTPALDAPLSGS